VPSPPDGLAETDSNVLSHLVRVILRGLDVDMSTDYEYHPVNDSFPNLSKTSGEGLRPKSRKAVPVPGAYEMEEE
jgi:hypothetical protein